VKFLKDQHFGKINAETSHGDIAVSVVPASDTRIEVFVRSNNNNEQLSKAEIQKLLDENYTLDISVSGDQLTAVARQKTNFNWKRSLSISYKIYATKSTNTRLITSHGNIDLSGMEGTQDVSTSHGNINIEDATGKLTGQTSHGDISISGSKDNIDFRTSHGNIDVRNAEGTLKLVTSNGDIQSRKIKGQIRMSTSHGNIGGNTIEGDLSASTSHGNVNVEGLSGSIEASTDHGNIDVVMEKVSGSITIDNSNGDISLQLPKGKGLNVDLEGKKINIDPLENFSGSKEENSMKGTLGGGGALVKAKTNRGNVSLSFR